MDTVPTAELVLDFDLYPRQGIDTYHVTRLAEHLAAGAQLPPVTACRATRRLVDGFHRVRACQRAGHADITVEWRDYPDDAALLLDAITANAAHGRRMTAWDDARCALLARRLGITDDRLATAMQVRAEAIGRIRAVKIGRDDQRRPVAIKATISHLAGRTLTPSQVEGAGHVGGMSALFYVNQVRNLIEHDLLDAGNPRLLVRLAELRDLLNGLDLGGEPAAEAS